MVGGFEAFRIVLLREEKPHAHLKQFEHVRILGHGRWVTVIAE